MVMYTQGNIKKVFFMEKENMNMQTVIYMKVK